MIASLLRAGSRTSLGQMRKRATVFAIAATLVVIAGQLNPCDAADITIERGTIDAVTISPDGSTIVAAIYGWGEMEDDPTIVRWWNWSGTDSIWHFPGDRVGALAWAADGSLLVGGKTDDRSPVVPWWKLGAGGEVRAACKGQPRGPSERMSRGVASITELTTGQVVTGGTDQTLAVWDGCSPTWLNAETCCRNEQSILVTARGKEFETYGEGVWQDKQGGYYKDMGPRLWSPSPWKAVPIQASLPHDAATKATAIGADCTAKIDASGHVSVAGAHPWTTSIGGDDWRILAASRDCKTIAAATEGRIVKVTPP